LHFELHEAKAAIPNSWYRKRRGDLKPPRHAGFARAELEDKLSAQLKRPWILHTADFTEVASAEVIANGIELSVVEGIE
jgi:hypothetical protein